MPRAVRSSKYGGVDVLQVVEVARRCGATVVLAARPESCSESIRATVSTIRVKPIWPARKAATQASLAAL